MNRPRYKYLRISVTNRCDLSCRYCRSECLFKNKKDQAWSFKDIITSVKVLKGFGISHIRLTGGEQLLYKELPQLIGVLRLHCKSITVTTNGTRLEGMAKDLRLAGLNNINVHIDTADAKKYKWLTGVDVSAIIRGIKSAKKAGILLKLNTVLLRGINYDEIDSLIDLAVSIGAPLRLIELMPFCEPEFYKRHFVGMQSIFEKLHLMPINDTFGMGPAEYYKDRKRGAVIGIISPLTRKFCGYCDRLRLTSNGVLKRCLADEEGLSLSACSFNKVLIEEYMSANEYDHKDFLGAEDHSLRSIG